MAQQTIDLGSAPNDGTGDTIRDGGTKINANFDELYARTLDDLPDVDAYEPADGDILVWDASAGAWINTPNTGGGGSSTQHAEIAMSDLYSEISTGDLKASWVVPCDLTLDDVFTALTSAQSTSGVVTIDIRLKSSGSSIFTTKPSIDANEDTSLTGTAAVLATTSFSKGDILLFDLDAEGTSAKGLIAVLEYTPS